MLLADKDIFDEIGDGNIIIDPFSPTHMQPASYDVHLDDILLVPTEGPNISKLERLLIYLGMLKDRRQRTYYDPASDAQPMKRVRLFNRAAENITGEYYYLPPGGRALGCTQELLTLAPHVALAADIAGCSSLGRWFLFVHVTAGFIDPGWSGRLTLELYNASPWWLRIWAGMRIAQLRFYYTHSVPVQNYLDTGHYAGALMALPSAYKG